MPARLVVLSCILFFLIAVYVVVNYPGPKEQPYIRASDNVNIAPKQHETLSYVEPEEQPCIRRIRDVTIAPNQPETIYSRVYDSPINGHVIYKSLDAGISWRTIISSVHFSRIGLLVDPENSNILYFRESYSSTGIRGTKSTDGGRSWNTIQAGPRIINPHNSAIIYATGPGGIRKSTDGGAGWTDLKGDWNSCGAIALAPRDPRILYAYCRREPERGIFKSINAGADWNLVLPARDIENLAVDPDDSEIVYAGTRFWGVFRSIDGGKQWNTARYGLPKSRYDSAWGTGDAGTDSWGSSPSGLPMNEAIRHLVIDPIHSSIYVGTSSGVFKSIDRAVSWRGINNGLPPRYPGVSALAINPKNPNIIYAGTWARGIFKSIDGGVHWVPASTGITCGPSFSYL